MTQPSSQPPTIDELRARRDVILRVAAAHRVTNIRVFGSVARGDAGATSDVDFVVDVPRDVRGFAYFGLLEDLRRDLEAVLGCHVDVVSLSGSGSPRGKEIAARIQREALEL